MSTGKRSQEFLFENRPYNEDCSELERQAIFDRVKLIDTKIIGIKEIPCTSIFSVALQFSQVAHLGAHLKKYGLLIDVRQANKPSAEARRKINDELLKASPRLSHVSFCTGKNVVFNTLVKFVMFRTNLESFSFHSTMEECLAAIKNASDE